VLTDLGANSFPEHGQRLWATAIEALGQDDPEVGDGPELGLGLDAFGDHGGPLSFGPAA